MKLIRVRCTNCGADFENVDDSQSVFHCTRPGCGATFVVEQGRKFSELEVEKTEQIEKYREALKKSLQPFDESQARLYAQQILAMIPEDFRARTILALCELKQGKPRALRRLLEKRAACSDEEFREVFPLILRMSEYRELMQLEGAVDMYVPDKGDVSAMKRQIVDRKEEIRVSSERYADIPRDVFICHSSMQADFAMRVVEELEKDGDTCWISSRNLLPDAPDYWREIERAVSRCRVFLVLCSEAAMLSKDVQAELRYAERYKNGRLELKLDAVPHTTQFKYFFNGITWVDATGGLEAALPELKRRLYMLLHAAEQRAREEAQAREAEKARLEAEALAAEVARIKAEEAARKAAEEEAARLVAEEAARKEAEEAARLAAEEAARKDAEEARKAEETRIAEEAKARKQREAAPSNGETAAQALARKRTRHGYIWFGLFVLISCAAYGSLENASFKLPKNPLAYLISVLVVLFCLLARSRTKPHVFTALLTVLPLWAGAVLGNVRPSSLLNRAWFTLRKCFVEGRPATLLLGTIVAVVTFALPFRKKKQDDHAFAVATTGKAKAWFALLSLVALVYPGIVVYDLYQGRMHVSDFSTAFLMMRFCYAFSLIALLHALLLQTRKTHIVSALLISIPCQLTTALTYIGTASLPEETILVISYSPPAAIVLGLILALIFWNRDKAQDAKGA